MDERERERENDNPKKHVSPLNGMLFFCDPSTFLSSSNWSYSLQSTILTRSREIVKRMGRDRQRMLLVEEERES